ncbi:unnamed protein product [Periconia digitata]|uniref:Uncharacterized protein n=1 Tax=Periconia digitata TaxID=1303443 RepID=A0A9W4U8Q2_9PLEO|nr:unnamed protein product [Periconia digitata]
MLEASIFSNIYNSLYAGHGPLSGYFDPKCVPTGRPVADLHDLNWFDYYYSPAICPYGWETATTLGSTVFGYSAKADLGPETTAVACCPSDYTYSQYGHACMSSGTRDQVIQYILPATQDGTVYPGSVSFSTLPSDTWFRANGIQAWRQSTDNAVLDAAAAQSSTIIRTTPSSTPASTPATTTPSSPSPPSSQSSIPDSGIARSTKLGLAVGLPVAALVAILIAILLIYRRRRTRSAELADTQYAPQVQEKPPAQQYASYEIAGAEVVHELGSEQYHELPPNHQVTSVRS